MVYSNFIIFCDLEKQDSYGKNEIQMIWKKLSINVLVLNLNWKYQY